MHSLLSDLKRYIWKWILFAIPKTESLLVSICYINHCTFAVRVSSLLNNPRMENIFRVSLSTSSVSGLHRIALFNQYATTCILMQKHNIRWKCFSLWPAYWHRKNYLNVQLILNSATPKPEIRILYVYVEKERCYSIKSIVELSWEWKMKDKFLCFSSSTMLYEDTNP